MTDQRRRAGRLGLTALGAVAFFFLVGVQLPLFFPHFPDRPVPSDLANYLAGARVGLHAGWQHLYDPALQAVEYKALTGAATFAWFDLYVSPPPVAWLVSPLTPLGLTPAYWVWNAAGFAVFAFACWRACPWTGLPRAVALLVGFGLYPVLIAFQFGQVTPLVAAAVVLAWAELRAGRDVTAGVLLAVIVLKPQVAVLVPVTLLLTGRARCFAVWAGAALLLTVASLLVIGPTGLSALLNDLAEEQRHLDNQVWTVASLVGVGVQTVVAEVLLAAVALAAGWAARQRGDVTLAVVAGSLGTLLAAGYHHSIDFPALFPLGLLQLGRLRGWSAAAFATGGVAVCLVIPALGPAPILLFQCAWLIAATVAGWRPAERRATHGPLPAPA